MELVGLEPNVITYTAAIQSCEVTGDCGGALDLLDMMRSSGIAPNEITFCCLINVASRGLAADLAINILREMRNLGFPPNVLCYGSALTACAKVGLWEELENLLDELVEAGLAQESVLISVINACRSPHSTQLDKKPATDVDRILWSHYPADMAPAEDRWARAVWLVKRYGKRIGKRLDLILL
jgi:pentatricopeptide repeat protein